MSKHLKQIAIYGKGGIGKSTTTSNISAALSTAGYRVMQVGCDPKSDSTNTLRGGHYIPTVLDTLREKSTVKADEVVFQGFNGIYCVEAGGPAPGVGCAGRGIITAVELLRNLKVYDDLDLDIVIYDVLGDVVCGGFAVPIREGIAEHVFTVSSADFMAIYAANNLFKGIKKYSNSGGALLGGVIANSINLPYQKAIIDDFVAHTETQVVEDGYRSRTRLGTIFDLPKTGGENRRPYGVAYSYATGRSGLEGLGFEVGGYPSGDREKRRSNGGGVEYLNGGSVCILKATPSRGIPAFNRAPDKSSGGFTCPSARSAIFNAGFATVASTKPKNAPASRVKF
jgi:nitrogenase iron protein NifH